MKLDPRVKMALAVCLTIIVFLPLSVYGIAIYTAISIIFSLLLQGLSGTLRSLRSLGLFLVLIILMSPLMERSGQVLINLGAFHLLYRDGLVLALATAFRFVSISMAFSSLLGSSTQNEILMSLYALGLGRRSCLVISLTLSFIPFIGESFKRINESQKLRLGEDGHFSRWLFASLVSALVMTLRSTAPRAMALESRGCMLTGKLTGLVKLQSPLRAVLQTLALAAGFAVSYIGVRLI
ncbi:MAG: energy-coupling factor transporter transmembrane component T [Sphaerochaetaceae bacterium]|nr:energy-coupling factor transporter transmembrane component T [Sphaerochaetaceae bacterium]